MGRPRSFDVERALVLVEAMFLDRGYDGVSVGELADALGIHPPSLYGAFGSKAGLFARLLERCNAERVQMVIDGLAMRGPASVAVERALIIGARSYAPGTRGKRGGCLVLEATRIVSDDHVRKLAAGYKTRLVTAFASRLAADVPPRRAAELADVLATALVGMSAAGRDGASLAHLLAVADLIAAGVRSQLRARAA